MRAGITHEDLTKALPDVRGSVRVPGLQAEVEVWRDAEGIPHVRAASVHDAFVAQGFVHAQDRLWHMEYDRRRACGRWAEYAGPSALAQDIQMRRFRLEASARADYAAVNDETRAMLDAYAAGVNVFLRTTTTLPIEYHLVEGRPEPWEPWDSLAVFKVRHVLMGVWQMKAWRARLLRHLGPGKTSQLCPGTQPNPMLIVPPGAEYRGPALDGLQELTAGEAALAHLPEWENGSNNWAVAGGRTASGKPLLAGDPHRPLDTPNVYYQNHLACPEFDVIGLSFPGCPGFPHFGHNQSVAWCVTHTAADYQDLYVERFDPARPSRYEFRGEWRQADTARESIRVRGAAPVEIEVTATHHGPVVLGDPKTGYGFACRYTATSGPNLGFEAFLPMLRATSAGALEVAMRPWVDPVNNFVFADVHGTIGYRTRGHIPIRSMANAWVPVPGWDGAHEWEGMIPFEQMPALRNPETGFLATANSKVAGPEYLHYIGLDFAPDFRTRRVVDRLRQIRGATVADMAAIHADRLSIPAREFVELLKQISPPDAHTRAALELLLAWDGVMDRDSVPATIYAVFRERLVRQLMEPILGPLTAEAFAEAPRGAVAHMARVRARLAEMVRHCDRTLLPPGGDWPGAMARALSDAVADLRATLGPDLSVWRWGRIHATQPQHSLSATFPDLAPLLNPPSVPMGGDGDTVQAASFIAGAGYGVTSTSVARYVFDLGDWDRSAWIVPLGASGHPGSPHYADQAGVWGAVRLLPMRYDWTRIRQEAETRQVLEPA
jgi:penicillin amidase